MLLVFLAAFLGSFGAVFLKSGAGKLHRSLKTLILNWRLGVGVGFYLISSYPMVSLGYVWTLLWSRLFFKESMTRNKFLGIGLVLVGIVLLNLGNR
jgi:multidrug transporter EmrE-like cation transporter